MIEGPLVALEFWKKEISTGAAGYLKVRQKRVIHGTVLGKVNAVFQVELRVGIT